MKPYDSPKALDLFLKDQVAYHFLEEEDGKEWLVEGDEAIGDVYIEGLAVNGKSPSDTPLKSLLGGQTSAFCTLKGEGSVEYEGSGYRDFTFAGSCEIDLDGNMDDISIESVRFDGAGD